MVTDANSCTAMDTVYILSTVSVKDIDGIDGDLKIYPNPASDMFVIEYLAGGQADLTLEIINMNSQIVLTRYFKNVTRIDETLDVSGIPAGIYLLRIRNQFKSAWHKVVIQ